METLLRRLYSFWISWGFAWRIWRLNRKINLQVDRTCQIHPGALIKVWKGGSIQIGRGTELLPGVIIMTYGGNIVIGEECSINPYAILYGHGGLTIGNQVLIAGGVMVIPSNHNFTDKFLPISKQGNSAMGIVIEDDVWIGHGCTILDNVRIGKGSVIAAGSVVNKDVAPYTVVGGVPAQLIKNR